MHQPPIHYNSRTGCDRESSGTTPMVLRTDIVLPSPEHCQAAVRPERRAVQQLMFWAILGNAPWERWDSWASWDCGFQQLADSWNPVKDRIPPSPPESIACPAMPSKNDQC